MPGRKRRGQQIAADEAVAFASDARAIATDLKREIEQMESDRLALQTPAKDHQAADSLGLPSWKEQAEHLLSTAHDVSRPDGKVDTVTINGDILYSYSNGRGIYKSDLAQALEAGYPNVDLYQQHDPSLALLRQHREELEAEERRAKEAERKKRNAELLEEQRLRDIEIAEERRKKLLDAELARMERKKRQAEERAETARVAALSFEEKVEDEKGSRSDEEFLTELIGEHFSLYRVVHPEHRYGGATDAKRLQAAADAEPRFKFVSAAIELLRKRETARVDQQRKEYAEAYADGLRARGLSIAELTAVLSYQRERQADLAMWDAEIMSARILAGEKRLEQLAAGDLSEPPAQPSWFSKRATPRAF